jgi:hypothetical protein
LADSLSIPNSKIAMIGVGVHEASVIEAVNRILHEGESTVPYPIDIFSPTLSTPALRRALKTKTHVLVVVSAGRHSIREIRNFIGKLAYSGRIGFVLVDVHPEYASLADFAGNIAAFWRAPDRQRQRRKRRAKFA